MNNPNQDPTDEQLRIEVAGLMGWTDLRVEWFLGERVLAGVDSSIKHGPKLRAVPRFHESLDACAEMERSLSEGEDGEWSERDEYMSQLCRITGAEPSMLKVWALATATPRQRCLAFIQAKKGVTR